MAGVDENDRRLLFWNIQGCQDVTYRSALLVIEVVNGKPILAQGSEQFDGNFHLKIHLIKLRGRLGVAPATCLPIKQTVQLFVFDHELHIMRRYGVGIEEPRQAVVLFGETGAFVEIALYL